MRPRVELGIVMILVVFLAGIINPRLVSMDASAESLVLDQYAVLLDDFDFDREGHEHIRIRTLREAAEENGFKYGGRVANIPDAVLITRSRYPRDSRGDAGPLGSMVEHMKVHGNMTIHKMEPVKRFLRGTPIKMSNRDTSEDIASMRFAIGRRNKLKNDLNIHDPEFDSQWHLFNTLQVGNDLNIGKVWKSGVTGKGVVVSVIDDGLDFNHPDIAPAYLNEASVDLVRESREVIPSTKITNAHGTRCAAEIVARRNDVCGIGVAYDANIAIIRFIGDSGDVIDSQEAEALTYANQLTDIYTCSWGPSDLGDSVDGPGILAKKALESGVAKGRQGKGNIYVFAGGNGGRDGDHCNFDGYVNSIYTLTIGSVDRRDTHPKYSEECSSILAVTYSSDSNKRNGIFTGDILGSCTSEHSGTSASAPLAAGLYALVLQKRPELTWRDVQQLTVLSAIPVNLSDGSWDPTSGKRMFSNKYGFGKLDAQRMMHVAKHMLMMRPQVYISTPSDEPPMGDGKLDGVGSVVTRIIEVTRKQAEDADLSTVEQVGVTVSLEYSVRGMLDISLTSPQGVKSQIAAPRRKDLSSGALYQWTFATVKNWGENPVGNWKLQIVVSDIKGVNIPRDPRGRLFNWKLDIWGEKGINLPSSFILNEERLARHEGEIESPNSDSSDRGKGDDKNFSLTAVSMIIGGLLFLIAAVSISIYMCLKKYFSGEIGDASKKYGYTNDLQHEYAGADQIQVKMTHSPPSLQKLKIGDTYGTGSYYPLPPNNDNYYEYKNSPP